MRVEHKHLDIKVYEVMRAFDEFVWHFCNKNINSSLEKYIQTISLESEIKRVVSSVSPTCMPLYTWAGLTQIYVYITSSFARECKFKKECDQHLRRCRGLCVVLDQRLKILTKKYSHLLLRYFTSSSGSTVIKGWVNLLNRRCDDR